MVRQPALVKHTCGTAVFWRLRAGRCELKNDYVQNRGERGSRRGQAFPRFARCLSPSGEQRRKRSRCRAGLLQYCERFSKSSKPLHQIAPLSGNNLSLLQKRFVGHSRRLRDWDQWSGEVRQDTHRADGDWRVVPRLAVSCDHTADVCPVQIGCRCLEQRKQVKAKNEGCRMSGRGPDRQTERRRSPNEAFMHGREYTAPCGTLPSLAPASTDGGTAARKHCRGVPMDDQSWSSYIQLSDVKG
jgi:hypothetical protein